MALPGHGLYVVKGELSIVLTALRKTYAPSDSHQNNNQNNLKSLITAFEELKETLNEVNDLLLVESSIYLDPFLKVICSKKTTSPVISLALVSVNKFLSYGILEARDGSVSIVVQNIADAVKKAQFVAQDASSNIVAVGKVLHLFQTLVLGPQGSYLTNESLGELMSFCLCIFHTLGDAEHARKIMGHCLKQVVQFLFMHLSQVTENRSDENVKHLKVKFDTMEQNMGKIITVAVANKISLKDKQQDYNADVLFSPYDSTAVCAVFKILINLCDASDKQKTDIMVQTGLSLLTVAFEVSADTIGRFPSLLDLVKNKLCRNLLLLLNTEKLSIFAAVLQLSFLVFESLRNHLKFQLEMYLIKLVEIITSNDLVKATVEHKETALNNVLQLWRIPGFITELYVNYDCNLYSSNLCEYLIVRLSKNAIPTTANVNSVHLMSLDSLLIIIESIKKNCLENNTGAVEKLNKKSAVAENVNSRIRIMKNVPKEEDVMSVKNVKKWLSAGTDLFNSSPAKGIQHLHKYGVLKSEFDTKEIVTFLKENQNLDKKMIGEYISNRNNLPVLEEFVKSFDFTNMRIDKALRLFLEAFRLPGEAPLISLVLEQFAEYWHQSNCEPFVNADSAYTLSYAVIILNVDQHNHNATRKNNPMTLQQFKTNLEKSNGEDGFDQDMLDEIYNAIKNEEIVMPSEQTGTVLENYLWKLLLRRNAEYYHITSNAYDHNLFNLIQGATVSTLSFIYDKSQDPNLCERIIRDFESCAFISSHFGDTANLDLLVLKLSKFTLLDKDISYVQFASNVKAQLGLKTVFLLSHKFGDNIRNGWKNIFELILSLYKRNMLPKCYLEAKDFVDSSGRVYLTYTQIGNSLYSCMRSSDIPQDAMEMVFIREYYDHLISDSKRLEQGAFLEMVKTLVKFSRGPDAEQLGCDYNESVAVFFLQLLINVIVQNNKHVPIIWPSLRNHIYTLVMNASHFNFEFLLERTVIGVLHLAIRLMTNEEMSPVVIQISYGLLELLKNSAKEIHTNADWNVIFTLLESVGAGHEAKSGGGNVTHNAEEWIIVANPGGIQASVAQKVSPFNTLVFQRTLGYHDPRSFNKCCESLAFLIKIVKHVTPHNFDDCVHCLHTFVEAILYEKTGEEWRRKVCDSSMPGSCDDERTYGRLPIQLVDLMFTLHIHTSQILCCKENGEVPRKMSLWTNGWCPLLQGIARLCCDFRREVRMNALKHLQKALLIPDLQTLSGPDCEECFQKVVFPLLWYLLQPIGVNDPVAMVETRMRAVMLLSKVFLYHLNPLLTVPTFSSLWTTVLDFMERYTHAGNSDLLSEAVPDSLRNMLSHIDSAKVFEDESRGPLWELTWKRIDAFLPDFKEEFFGQKFQTMSPSTSLPMYENAFNETTRSSVESARSVGGQVLVPHTEKIDGSCRNEAVGGDNS